MAGESSESEESEGDATEEDEEEGEGDEPQSKANPSTRCPKEPIARGRRVPTKKEGKHKIYLRHKHVSVLPASLCKMLNLRNGAFDLVLSYGGVDQVPSREASGGGVGRVGGGSTTTKSRTPPGESFTLSTPPPWSACSWRPTLTGTSTRQQSQGGV